MTRDGNNMPQEEVDDKFKRLMTIELLAAQPWWKCPMRCQVCGRPFDLTGDWVGDRHDGYITGLTCPDCATPEGIEKARQFDATHEYVEKPTGQLWATTRD
ncbi:hypothetical protein [Bifidobacterium thermophilum]|uniref:hypothetical protein n=1 Tax=Bifidobacterium thermophilum TaxID=33905 RepID=UPI003991ABE9